LTSRRACCPLCKADYYTPKPRPEADAAEAERRRNRANMPQAPPSAWTGIRGNPRLMLPGRFGGSPAMYAGTDQHAQGDNTRAGRRARRDAATADNGIDAGEVAHSEPNTSRRWVPRISNPFSSMRMPALRPITGSNNRRGAAAEQGVPTAADASPSQLEAGVVR